MSAAKNKVKSPVFSQARSCCREKDIDQIGRARAECAVAISKENVHGAGAVVPHSHIGDAVAIEIADDERVGNSSEWRVRPRLKLRKQRQARRCPQHKGNGCSCYESTGHASPRRTPAYEA